MGEMHAIDETLFTRSSQGVCRQWHIPTGKRVETFKVQWPAPDFDWYSYQYENYWVPRTLHAAEGELFTSFRDSLVRYDAWGLMPWSEQSHENHPVKFRRKVSALCIIYAVNEGPLAQSGVSVHVLGEIFQELLQLQRGF